jgi:hypothetical protein
VFDDDAGPEFEDDAELIVISGEDNLCDVVVPKADIKEDGIVITVRSLPCYEGDHSAFFCVRCVRGIRCLRSCWECTCCAWQRIPFLAEHIIFIK